MFFLGTLFSFTVLFNPIVAHYHAPGDRCHTQSPSTAESKAMQSNITLFQRSNSLARSGSRTCVQCITIDTYFWVFQPDNTFNSEGETIYRVNDAKAREQFNVLVDRYRDTPFTFRLMGIQIITNNQYYASLDNSNQIGQQYRQGGWDTLNCYFGAADDGSYAFFPSLTSLESSSVSPEDGTFNDISTMPGVDPDESACCRLGLTLVHEVGHWLGLHHTFEQQTGFKDDGCNPNNPGDYVDDTPQQFTNTDFFCPSDNTNTCPNLPGNDPIHNYMDYSSDDCYTEFTRGQMDRMFAVWSLYRQRNEVCGTGSSKFDFEIRTDNSAFQTNWQLEATDGSFLINQANGGFEIEISDHSDSTLQHDICLTNGKEFRFTIFDTGNNGLNSGRGYTLRLNGVVIKEGQAFGSSEVTTFTTVEVAVPPTPNPTSGFVISTPPPVPTTALPTSSPVIVPVTVAIKFDAFAEETGVSITDSSGITLVNHIEGTFRDTEYAEQIYSETLNLQYGQSYTLTVTDSYGDGLQGDDSPAGYFAVYYGSSQDPVTLMTKEDNFSNERAVVVFTVIDPSASNPTPAPTAPTGFCFSGLTYVEMEDKRKKLMRDVRIGDKVLAANNKYERVYVFGHRDPKAEALFLQFSPSSLELTPDHMVFVDGYRDPVPASLVKVGDRFKDGQVVEKITHIMREGVYAPFTPSGMISVNGILSSTYVSLQQNSERLTLGRNGNIVTPFSHQWLDHTALGPQRLWCYWMGMEEEMNDAPKLFSNWVENPRAWASWFLSQNAVVMGLLMIPLVFSCVVSNVIESILLASRNHFVVGSLFIVLLGLYLRVRQKNAKTRATSL